MAKDKLIYLPMSILTGVTVVSTAVLASAGVTAVQANSSVTASVTVAAACSFLVHSGDTVEGSSIVNTKIANLVPGSYDNTSFANMSTVEAVCNNPNGLAVYARGESTNDIATRNRLVGTDPNNYIATGTATSGDTSAWAMKLTTNSADTTKLTIESAFSNYTAVPNTYTKVASFANGTTSNAGAKMVTNYAVYPAVTQVADTYTGRVIYTVVNPATAGGPTIDNITTMQDFASLSNDELTMVKNSMTTYDGTNDYAIYELSDNRDNTTYHVAKLADGNVWMLDNLALDLVAKKNVLDSTNTNASDTTLGYLKNGGGTTSDQWAINGVSDNWTSSFSYSAPLINMASKDIVPSDSLSQAGGWKVGGYYNYCAASAGSYCYGNGTGAGTSSGDATEDICPKGWRMPTGDASGEYQALATAITGTTGNFNDTTQYNNFRNTLKTPLSGYFNGGSVYSQGFYGRFWSSTRNDNGFMYYFSMYTTTVYPQIYSSRYYGYSVRCMLGEAKSISDISTMQEFGMLSSREKDDIKSSMPTYNGTNTSAIYNLVDGRDSTEYHIAKLADGNVWLLDNLALDIVDKIDVMNSTNTNALDDTLGYLKNGGGTTSDQYATAGVANWTSSYSYSAPLINMDSKDVVPSDSLSQADSWKVGGYYNYCAATAGSYCYGDDTNAGTTSGDATEDICPKGWRMPTGGASGEYQALATAITGATGQFSDATKINNFRNALKTPLSGHFLNGSASNQGSVGIFWSSTMNDVNYMFSLATTTTIVNPRYDDTRRFGYSVRCILSY